MGPTLNYVNRITEETFADHHECPPYGQQPVPAGHACSTTLLRGLHGGWRLRSSSSANVPWSAWQGRSSSSPWLLSSATSWLLPSAASWLLPSAASAGGHSGAVREPALVQPPPPDHDLPSLPGPHHDQDPVRAQRGGLDCGGAPLYRGLLAFRLHSLLCGQHAAGDPLLPQLQQLPGKIQGRALRFFYSPFWGVQHIIYSTLENLVMPLDILCYQSTTRARSIFARFGNDVLA